MGASHLTLQMEGPGHTGQTRAQSEAPGSLTTAFPARPARCGLRFIPKAALLSQGRGETSKSGAPGFWSVVP